MKPTRIQLSRKKGWRKPENTVVVSRPSVWGNPFRVTPNRGHAETVRLFEEYVNQNPYYIIAAKRELRGKNLACWCHLDCVCHADVLLRIANSP